jgi:hypothetical protein
MGHLSTVRFQGVNNNTKASNVSFQKKEVDLSNIPAYFNAGQEVLTSAKQPLTTGGVLTGFTTMLTALTMVIDRYAAQIKSGVDRLRSSGNVVVRTLGKVIGTVLSLFAAVGASEEAKAILNLPSKGAQEVINVIPKRRKRRKKPAPAKLEANGVAQEKNTGRKKADKK